MNEINTTTKLWLAVTMCGEFLCHGNPNEHLSYHLTYYWEPLKDRIVHGTRRWEIMEHIKKWNKQCRGKVFKCKPVKVTITIKEIKRGDNND